MQQLMIAGVPKAVDDISKFSMIVIILPTRKVKYKSRTYRWQKTDQGCQDTQDQYGPGSDHGLEEAKDSMVSSITAPSIMVITPLSFLSLRMMIPRHLSPHAL